MQQKLRIYTGMQHQVLAFDRPSLLGSPGCWPGDS